MAKPNAAGIKLVVITRRQPFFAVVLNAQSVLRRSPTAVAGNSTANLATTYMAGTAARSPQYFSYPLENWMPAKAAPTATSMTGTTINKTQRNTTAPHPKNLVSGDVHECNTYS